MTECLVFPKCIRTQSIYTFTCFHVMYKRVNLDTYMYSHVYLFYLCRYLHIYIHTFLCRQQCTTIIGYSFLDKCIFVQAAVYICFFNHMHISAVRVLIGFPWKASPCQPPKKGVLHHDAFGHVLGCLWALCTSVGLWMEVAPVSPKGMQNSPPNEEW